jgi:hypothetical protein
MTFQKVVDMILVIRTCIDRFTAERVVSRKDTDLFFPVATCGGRANPRPFRRREFLS